MATFVISFLIIALIVGGMAIGVMFGREPIKGSCGGLNNPGADEDCEVCGGSPAKCEENQKS